MGIISVITMFYVQNTKRKLGMQGITDLILNNPLVGQAHLRFSMMNLGAPNGLQTMIFRLIDGFLVIA